MGEQISMFGTAYHGPAVVKGQDDEWIVICPACSEDNQAIVNNCEYCQEFPPRVLVPITYKDTLKRIRGTKKNSVALPEHPSDTQEEAAKKVEPKIGTRKAMIYDLIVAFGGLSDSEIERITHLSHQSASAARNSLMRDGLIMDSGERIFNSRGNREIVWVRVP